MNEEYLDTAHRYLEGTLTAPERDAFEAVLNNNPALRHDVELERLLLAGIAYAGESSLKKNIRTVHEKLKAENFFETQEKSPAGFVATFFSKKGIFQRITAIAASLALLAAAVWFFAKNNSAIDPKAVFARYDQPEDDLQRAKKLSDALESYGLAGAATQTDSLRRALQLFEAGKHEDARVALSKLIETQANNDTLQYYLGVVQMRLQNYPQAIAVFHPLSEVPSSAWKNDALWRLGLCYLNTDGGLEKAREVFVALARDPEDQKAKAILEQLSP